MQIAASNIRWSAYGATLAVVVLASSATAVTRLSLTQDLGALDLVLLRCGIGGALLLLAGPALSALWMASPSEVITQAVFQGLGMGAGAILLVSHATRRLRSRRFSVFLAAIPVFSMFLVGPSQVTTSTATKPWRWCSSARAASLLGGCLTHSAANATFLEGGP